jgi:hypothetical protein
MAHGRPRAGDQDKAATGSASSAGPVSSGPVPPGGPVSWASPASWAGLGLTIRIALAAVLLAVVFAAVRATVPATSWDTGPWHRYGVLLGIGLELVFIALLVAVELRRRRWPDPGQPAAGLRSLLRAILIAGALGIPVLILIDSAGKLKPGRPRVPSSLRRLALPRSGRPPSPTSHGGGSSGTLILYIVLTAVLLAAIVACVILLRRRVRGASWDDIGEIADDEPAEQLRRAVRSGQAALSDIDDARLAIIACYLAMERSLARAGAVRAAAETPDELLARAVEAELVQGAEAAALTALFYEARFSSHPLAPAKRREARRALDVLALSLEVKAESATGTGPAGGPP